MNEEKRPYLIINEEYDEIKINIKHTKPYMKLQQENQQLKEKRDLAVQKANEEREKNVDLEIELDKYKEVIEEVRKYINNLSLDFYDCECNQLIVGKYMIDELLQILDKATLLEK